MSHDVIIVGSGAAGLTAALALAEQVKVLVLAKGAIDGGSTAWAQGGIAAVLDAGDEGDDWAGIDRLVVEQIDAVQAQFDGQGEADRFIPTGLSELDELLDGGLRGGNLIIVGARPSMGKTALADTIALHVAMNLGLPVGKFSMEMQNSEGGQRSLASVGRIPLHALRRPERLADEHWERMTRAAERLRQAPLYSYDRGGLNINQVRAKARSLKRKHGLRMLVVDYVQLMSGIDGRQQRSAQLEEASRGLKSLAKELDIPIIALAQVLRGVEKEADPMPRMSDLKDCGSFEQDADIVLFLHRPIVLKPALGADWKPAAQCRLAKQRGGRTGDFHLHYQGEYTKFSTWPKDVPYPTPIAATRGGNL